MKNQGFKALRLHRGYTQEGLGLELRIAGDYVNMIENGRRTPGFALAKRIADFFGVTVDELFFYPDYEQNIHNTSYIDKTVRIKGDSDK